MRLFVKLLVLYLILTFASLVAVRYLGIEFGTGNYWDKRGILFLFFITLFPRLTLLLSSVPFGGVLWWLGWIFAPRLLVAILATVTYWNQNPILVMISWLVALGGESGEKYVVRRQVVVSIDERKRYH